MMCLFTQIQFRNMSECAHDLQFCAQDLWLPLIWPVSQIQIKPGPRLRMMFNGESPLTIAVESRTRLDLCPGNQPNMKQCLNQSMCICCRSRL